MIPYPVKYKFPTPGLGLVNGTTGAVIDSNIIEKEISIDIVKKMISEVWISLLGSHVRRPISLFKNFQLWKQEKYYYNIY